MWSSFIIHFQFVPFQKLKHIVPLVNESTFKASEGYMGGWWRWWWMFALFVCKYIPQKTSPEVPTKDFEVALFVFDEETRHGSGGVE